MNNPFQPAWASGVVTPIYPESVHVTVGARVEETASKRGNPWARKRGEIVRAVIMTVMKREREIPMRSLQDVVGLSRTALTNQLSALREQGRIRGYATTQGMVKVW